MTLPKGARVVARGSVPRLTKRELRQLVSRASKKKEPDMPDARQPIMRAMAAAATLAGPTVRADVEFREQAEAIIDETPTLADAVEQLATLILNEGHLCTFEPEHWAARRAGLKARVNDLAGGR